MNYYLPANCNTCLLRKKLDTGHSGPISTIAVSPDGKQFITGSNNDKFIQIFDIETNKKVRKINLLFSVRDMCFSSNGKQILIFDINEHISCIRLNDEMLVWKISGGIENKFTTIWSFCVTPDGRYLITSDVCNCIHILQMDDGIMIHQMQPHSRSVTCICVTKDSRFVVSGSFDKTIQIRNLGGSLIRKIKTQKVPYIIQVTPDQNYIFMASMEEIFIFDFADGKMVRKCEYGTTICSLGGITNTNFFVGGYNGVISLNKIKNPKTGWEIHTHNGCQVNHLVLSPDEKYIISASSDPFVRITLNPIFLGKLKFWRWFFTLLLLNKKKNWNDSFVCIVHQIFSKNVGGIKCLGPRIRLFLI